MSAFVYINKLKKQKGTNKGFINYLRKTIEGKQNFMCVNL